ncbi:hypothetical protein ACPF04_01895 [Campylobacter sp. MOP51]
MRDKSDLLYHSGFYIANSFVLARHKFDKADILYPNLHKKIKISIF